MSLTVKVDLGGLDSLVDQLGAQAKEAIRPAAQAAAQVLYDAVRQNVKSIGRKTGNLESSIYQAYSDKSTEQRAVYHVSWNARKASHGGLVEYGHIQRYVIYQRRDGKFITKIRPGMEGKKRPSRNASQATKDAYYVPLAQPKQVAAKPFMRPAIDKFDAAAKAAELVLISRLMGGAP